MPTGAYSMQIGDADARRLQLLGQFYAVDASLDQLRIARSTSAHRPNVAFIQTRLEDVPLGRHVNWVYSRFLLMHVRDLDRAVNAMAHMLAEGGALLLEIADVGSLTFSPADTDSHLWRPWWYALGRTRGLSFDVADRIIDALHRAGFVIERRDRHQPIASTTPAKLVHALGFEQCTDAYLARSRRSPRTNQRPPPPHPPRAPRFRSDGRSLRKHPGRRRRN